MSFRSGQSVASAEIVKRPRPLVSVVVPVYNRPRLAIETLNSVLSNNYRPVEIVAVNDGSTDDTGVVLDAWAAKNRKADFSIRVINKTNGGCASARNSGAAASTGDLIAFLDSDDLLKPDMIEQLVKVLDANNADFAFGKTEQTLNGAVVATLGTALAPRLNSVPDHNWHVSALLIRSAALLRTGLFRPEIGLADDWEWEARVKALNSRGIFVPKILTYYRIHNGPQLVKQDAERYACGREKAIRYVHEVLCTLPPSPPSTFVPRAKCALMMLKNGARYYAIGDIEGFTRCANTACEWLGPLLGAPIRILAFCIRLIPLRLRMRLKSPTD